MVHGETPTASFLLKLNMSPANGGIDKDLETTSLLKKKTTQKAAAMPMKKIPCKSINDPETYE